MNEMDKDYLLLLLLFTVLFYHTAFLTQMPNNMAWLLYKFHMMWQTFSEILRNKCKIRLIHKIIYLAL